MVGKHTRKGRNCQPPRMNYILVRPKFSQLLPIMFSPRYITHTHSPHPLSLLPHLPHTHGTYYNSQSIDEAFLMNSSVNLLGKEPSIRSFSKVSLVHCRGDIATRAFLSIPLGCGESHGWILSPSRGRSGRSGTQNVTTVNREIVTFTWTAWSTLT